MKNIHQLPIDVVNRIAAGEVIQRPCNALKELIENSIDASSTQINVTASPTGGMSMTIADDGSGIGKHDLPLVCTRHATSKIARFEDLMHVSTFGFRGEALASLSHVAHVTITTKTKDSEVAWRAKYQDGKLVEQKACAGNQGTVINVDSLFWNVKMRSKALKPFAEEYSKMLDVVQRYAVHCAGRVGFNMKREKSVPDVATNPRLSCPDVIKSLYEVKDLLKLELELCKGWISGLDHKGKRTTSLIFINHRLVDCSALKKSIDSVYSTVLPRGTHPWFYLSLSLDPTTVDVNVHPTKSDVHFLDEDVIVQKVVEEVTRILSNVQTRSFAIGAMSGSPKQPQQSASSKDPRKMIRTDSKLQTLDTFWSKHTQPPTDACASPLQQSIEEAVDETVESIADTNDAIILDSDDEVVMYGQPGGGDKPNKRHKTDTWVQVKLNSVLALRKQEEEACHHALTEGFSKLTFVGCADTKLALIQVDLQLYLIDIGKATNALLYQLGLRYFANFGRASLEPACPVLECLQIALDDEEERRGGWEVGIQPKEEIALAIEQLLWTHRQMITDYFALHLSKTGDRVMLETLPIMLKGYEPPMEKLPLFLLRLGTEVDWTQEQPCFHGILTELANFYALQDYDVPDASKQAWVVEHLIVPSWRTSLLVPKEWTKQVLLEVASLPKLYRIFERC